MSLRINNNISALNAHRNLKTNDDQLARTLERLSSGLQVTRAADGPAKLVFSAREKSSGVYPDCWANTFIAKISSRAMEYRVFISIMFSSQRAKVQKPLRKYPAIEHPQGK